MAATTSRDTEAIKWRMFLIRNRMREVLLTLFMGSLHLKPVRRGMRRVLCPFDDWEFSVRWHNCNRSVRFVGTSAAFRDGPNTM